jgi:hypothetical protein
MEDASMLVLLSILGCKNVDPAPAGLDGLAHYLWDHFDDVETDALSAGIINLHAAIDGESRVDVTDGSISNLSGEQLASFGMDDEDSSRAYGIYMANLVEGCSLEDIEYLTYAADQDVLHPGTYVSYDREYTTDVDAYLAGDEELLTWLTTYEVSGFASDYIASLDGWLRRVPEVDTVSTPYGPVLLSRAVLTEPAFFSGSDERALYQDYQMEIYYERAPKEILHFYVIWRDMVPLANQDFSAESTQRLVLDGLAQWDQDSESYCTGE